jgi:hypothetical protein
LGDLNVPADATSLYQWFQVQTATVVLSIIKLTTSYRYASGLPLLRDLKFKRAKVELN